MAITPTLKIRLPSWRRERSWRPHYAASNHARQLPDTWRRSRAAPGSRHPAIPYPST